eukprot:9403960-Lingulodinium_polyedra.AAC.1
MYCIGPQLRAPMRAIVSFGNAADLCGNGHGAGRPTASGIAHPASGTTRHPRGDKTVTKWPGRKPCCAR